MTASAPYAKEQRVQVDPTQPLNCSLRTWPPPSRQFFTTTTCLPNAHSKWSKILLQKKERKRSLEKQSKTPELLASEFNLHMSSKPNRKNFAHFRYKIILLLKKKTMTWDIISHCLSKVSYIILKHIFLKCSSNRTYSVLLVNFCFSECTEIKQIDGSTVL